MGGGAWGKGRDRFETRSWNLREGCFSLNSPPPHTRVLTRPQQPTMPKKGGKYTMMTDKVCIPLCKHKKRNPTLSQAKLQRWLKSEHNIDVSQPMISQTLKCSAKLFRRDEDPNIQSKREWIVKFPTMEETLIEWILANQERIPIFGDLIKENAAKILDRLHPSHELFEFSNGWLEAFKLRHEIKSFHRFGESGSVNMNAVNLALPGICQLLDQYVWKEIYNMDETGLFFRMQVWDICCLIVICV